MFKKIFLLTICILGKWHFGEELSDKRTFLLVGTSCLKREFVGMSCQTSTPIFTEQRKEAVRSVLPTYFRKIHENGIYRLGICHFTGQNVMLLMDRSDR